MSKKKRNSQQPQNQSKPTPTVKPTLTDDQKLEIELKKDELEKDNVEPVDRSALTATPMNWKKQRKMNCPWRLFIIMPNP